MKAIVSLLALVLACCTSSGVTVTIAKAATGLIIVGASSTTNPPPHSGLWANAYGSTGTDYGQSVVTDASSNIFMCGVFSGTVNFGGTSKTSAGGYDVFVAKYNSAGALQWVTQYGGAGSETATDIALDGSGNVYVSGGLLTGELAKFNSSGTFQWVAGPIATAGQSVNFTSIATDSSGNILVTGDFKASFASQMDFGNSHPIYCPYNSVNAFLAKYSSAGACTLARDFVNFGDTQFGTGIAVGTNDIFYLSGYAFTGIDLGGGFMTNNVPGSIAFGFLGKFSSSAVLTWQRRCGTDLAGDSSSAFCRIRSMSLDHAGEVLMGGEFAVHSNMGGEPMDSGNAIITGASAIYDMLVVKYSGATGAHQWSKALTCNSNGRGNQKSIAADSSNNVLVSGLFYGTCNFGSQSLTVPNPIPTSVSDGFVAKYSSTGTPTWAQQFNGSDDGCYNVTADPGDSPVVCGLFGNTVNLVGAVLTTAGGYDIILGRLSP